MKQFLWRLAGVALVPSLVVACGAEPESELAPPPPEIALAFAGDVHFPDEDGGVPNWTGPGTPEPKSFLFRAPPAAFEAVRAAGVDVVSLANNYALDYGREGLADTLAYAAGAGVSGGGRGENAAAVYAPWVRRCRGYGWSTSA